MNKESFNVVKEIVLKHSFENGMCVESEFMFNEMLLKYKKLPSLSVFYLHVGCGTNSTPILINKTEIKGNLINIVWHKDLDNKGYILMEQSFSKTIGYII